MPAVGELIDLDAVLRAPEIVSLAASSRGDLKALSCAVYDSRRKIVSV
jgi:hypothetical protein